LKVSRAWSVPQILFFRLRWDYNPPDLPTVFQEPS